MRRNIYLLSFLFLLPFETLLAGGVRGVIKGPDGGALPYASIFVKQTGTGVVSDATGAYEISLLPGQYDIVYQFLGYETVSRLVEVSNSFVEVNIELKVQAIVLDNVTITADKEDPAYTIMRKAIAKSKYHTQQLDRYSAKVYIKGKGQLRDYPWMARKMVEKEGMFQRKISGRRNGCMKNQFFLC